MRLSVKYILIWGVLLGAISASGQQRRVVTGLEEHEEYRALVAEEQALVRMADSLSGSIETLRRTFRTDSLSRAENAAKILTMEGLSFDVTGRLTRLAARIDAIEQEWVLSSLEDGTGIAVGSEAEIPKDRQPANLVYGSYFEQNLSPEGLVELRDAQAAESALPILIERYRDNNSRMRALATEYQSAATQDALDGIKSDFDRLALAAAELDGEIAHKWETIFDNKGYAYSYLMDKANRGDMLALFEREMETLRAEQLRRQGVCASKAIEDYLLQKRMLTRYEIALAQELGNRTAADSLRKVEAALSHPDRLGLEPVRLRERLLLDYADIVAGASPYSARNPIPAVTVYPRGIMHRIHLGNFSTAQSPSIFRGVSPIAVEKTPEGRFRYYAGGFPSDSLAAVAVGKMRSAGFRSPKTVVWMDGIFFDPDAEKSTGERFFRIELSDIGDLSEETKQIIRSITAEGDIVRSGDGFIIGPIGDAGAARRLRTTLDTGEATVKIVAISE